MCTNHCNIFDFLLLNGSHITCWSEPFVGTFQVLKNQFYLLLGSMTNPTNQHKTFQYVLFSSICFLENFRKDYSSNNYFKLNTLNYGVLKRCVTKK